MRFQVFIGTVVSLVVLAMMELPRYVPVLGGIAFIILWMKLLKNMLREMVFFGATLGLLESWHFFYESVGIPPMPENLFIFSGTAIIFWSVIRLIWVLGFIPQLSFLKSFSEALA